MSANVEIRMAVPEEATIVGGLIYKMESELWPDQLDLFEKAAQMLLQPDTGLWVFVACLEGKQIVGTLTLNE